MARKLSIRQKKLLDKQLKNLISLDAMSNEDFEELVRLNDYETLWIDAERYLWDRAMEHIYGR